MACIAREIRVDRFDNIPETALAWHRAGEASCAGDRDPDMGICAASGGVAAGHQPRGRFGGVGVGWLCRGGCRDLEAQEALQMQQPRVLEYGVSDGDAFAVGLACGGTIKDTAGTGRDGFARGPAGGSGCGAAGAPSRGLRGEHRDRGATAGLAMGIEVRFRMDRSGFEEDQQTFVAVHNPPLRLVIVGAVHIAQALVPMARRGGI